MVMAYIYSIDGPGALHHAESAEAEVTRDDIEHFSA